MSQFAFLQPEWPDVFEAASRAESLAYPDPRTACFYARRALELVVFWLYKSDPALRLPYLEHLSALIHEPTFRTAVGPAIFAKVRLIKDLGNLAVHSHRPIRQLDALTAIRELHHFAFWLARTYARTTRPADSLTFDPAALPRTAGVPPQTQEQLQQLESRLHERNEILETLLADKANLDQELQRLRAEVAAARAANTAVADTHNLLLQWLRPPALGRCQLSTAPSARVF